MSKYIFRVIFYTTVVLSIFALTIDYENSKFFPWVFVLFCLIGAGGVISYNVLHDKTDKEVSEILGVPESLFSEE